MKNNRFLLVALLLALLVVSPLMAQDDEPIEFAYWALGVCDEYAGITDMEDTSNFEGEGPILCIMLNAYNEENPDNPVEPSVVDWPGTTQLNTRLAAGDPNDVSVIHGQRVPAYASRGLLTPIGPLLEEYGIDPGGWADSARESVTYNGEIYGVPFDIHALLTCYNLDLFEQAGMLNDDGTPMIPVGWEDWQAAGEQMYEATGAVMAEATAGAAWSVSPFLSLIHQQGGSVVDAEGNPAVNTPEAIAALNMILDWYNGTFSSEIGGDNWAVFFNGGTATTACGTWAVNFFDAQAADPETALSNYYVTTYMQLFDQPANWSESHTMVIPLGVNADPARVDQIMQFLAWMNDHNFVWANTGHFPVNQSDFESDAYLALPHRTEYIDLSEQAFSLPRENWSTALDPILNEALEAAATGIMTPEEALANAQERLDDLVAFGN
jgi:multiple sugar transport system substrate-binding protein